MLINSTFDAVMDLGKHIPNCEDPRAFRWGNLTYVMARVPPAAAPWTGPDPRDRAAAPGGRLRRRLDHAAAQDNHGWRQPHRMYEVASGAELPLHVSHSRTPAKNWIPIVADDRLLLVYQLDPLCLQACDKARPARRAERGRDSQARALMTACRGGGAGGEALQVL